MCEHDGETIRQYNAKMISAEHTIFFFLILFCSVVFKLYHYNLQQMNKYIL